MFIRMTYYQTSPCKRQVLFRRFHRRAREWQHTLALASTISPWTDYGRAPYIEITQIQRYQLAHTHTCRIEHMQHSKIALPGLRLYIYLAEQIANLLLAQNMWQASLYTRHI